MRDALAATDLTPLRFRDRIALAVKLRLHEADRELVRRGSALFALPNHAAEGTKAIWGTADAIWTALGDTSTDINWYTKRASLSAVYGATVLFWLGDDSPGHQATWDFLDRRIENVMSFEKTKARFRENPLGKALLAGPLKILERVHAPQRPQDLPGKTTERPEYDPVQRDARHGNLQPRRARCAETLLGARAGAGCMARSSSASPMPG